ncbi:MAG: glycosyltransferase [Lentisphaerae bacterium]|nr:glycosyltransferase [Lentisphaerota bacterium]
MPEQNAPKVSVLMPTYNSAEYMQEAVKSILTQSYTNFEFLVVDDASADDSWEILQKMARQDRRLKIFRQRKNCGVARSRNFLFEHISPASEFIAIMDSDDRSHPERLSRQVAFLQSRPDLYGVGSSLDIINEAGDLTGHRCYECSAQKILSSSIAANPFAHPSLLFRRSLLERVGQYDESFRSCEDYDFIMRVLEHHLMANLPERLLQYRISAKQWKQTHLKDSLRSTLAIQRRYLFQKRFFSPFGLLRHAANYPLLLLPSAWVMRLFVLLTYQGLDND